MFGSSSLLQILYVFARSFSRDIHSLNRQHGERSAIFTSPNAAEFDTSRQYRPCACKTNGAGPWPWRLRASLRSSSSLITAPTRTEFLSFPRWTVDSYSPNVWRLRSRPEAGSISGLTCLTFRDTLAWNFEWNYCCIGGSLAEAADNQES